MSACKLLECESPVQGKGYCNKHYQRLWKHGDVKVDLRTKHGMTRSKEYAAWHGAVARCYYAGNSVYKKRGITVCDEWRNSFEKFIKDVGLAPSKEHSLDRIDNDKGYEPGNVRWATKSEQDNNRSSCIYVTINGDTRTVSEWCKEFNISRYLVYNRLRIGWSAKRALGL